MRKWIFAFLFSVLAPAARGGNECLIEFALNETLGPPGSTSQVVSINPYDASTTGAGLRVCWASATGADKLGMDWQSAPSGATCSSADTSWIANERVDFTMTSLTAGTAYWYKIQCDAPDTKNPQNLWTNRPVYGFSTLPSAAADEDFNFTVVADTHFVARWMTPEASGGGQCGVREPHGAPAATQWRNLLYGLSQAGKARGLFHVDLGDTYMVDSGNATTCPNSSFTNPPDGSPIDDYDGFLYNQIPSWPTRNAGGFFSRGIQTSSIDATVRANADWHVWRMHRELQPILAFSPFVFAWGNHDFPRVDAGFSNTSGACNRWENDGQGSPKKATEHMGESWRSIVYNPNQFYPNLEADCDNGGATTCDNDGYYWTFKAGLAQFWVLNPTQAAGGGGTASNVPYDLSGRYPERPEDWELGQHQFQWFASTLAASTAKWKFIFLHHLPGGVDSMHFEASTLTTACYHYGRNAALATTGRRCDIDGDGIGEGKLCEIDDFAPQGFDETQDTRSAAWKATYGACPDAKRCMPSPYNNRTAAMAGGATYGQPAIHALLVANQDANGSTFFVQGHDHTTTAGCKYDATGCSEVWHVLGGQPEGSDDSGDIPPGWVDQGMFRIYSDYNGDTIPDYVTDGAPYETPLDKDALTIRSRGSNIRGFYKVYVSNEGVRFDYIATDKFDFPAKFATTLVSNQIGTQAILETDFDGTAGQDSQSKHTNAPVVAGNVDCDNVDTPLEGTQDCFFNASVLTATVTADAAWTDTTGLRVMDFLWRPISDANADSGGALARFRNDAVTSAGLQWNGLNNQLWLGSAGTISSVVNFTENVTYKVRLSYLGTTDVAEVWIDACGTNTCDSAANGSDLVPWGTGGTFHLTLDGPVANAETDGYIFRSSAVQKGNFFIDAVGICDLNPGAYKCGDNWE